MSSPSGQPPPNPGLRTLLVIDDDASLRMVLAEALESHGYHTLTAPDAAEGIGLARAHLPDLILCDIDMPGMSGRALLTTLRADPELADRQFVLMTGNAAYADPRAAMAIGADDFLIKPFLVTDLFSCVTARLKRAEISRHLEGSVIEQLRQNLHTTLPHEFFTPLAGMFGLTEMLEEELDTLPKDEVRAMLRDIRSAARRLHRTLRNYLFILELDGQGAAPASLLPGPVAVDALTAGINAAAARHKREADLSVDLCQSSLHASPADLTALAEELVDNACSFSRTGTPIRVALREAGAGRTEFSVADEGRGMTPKQVQQLGIFQQHDRKKHEQQGLGLGLVLVRKITHRLGGGLHIASEPGKGTLVRASLPTALAAG